MSILFHVQHLREKLGSFFSFSTLSTLGISSLSIHQSVITYIEGNTWWNEIRLNCQWKISKKVLPRTWEIEQIQTRKIPLRNKLLRHKCLQIRLRIEQFPKRSRYRHRSRLRVTTDEKLVHVIELFPEVLDFCFNILQSPGIVPWLSVRMIQ